MKIKWIVGTLLIIAFFACFLGFMYVMYGRPLHMEDYKKRTTPLPDETRELLCSRFDLAPDDSLCDEKRDVYALDFVETIMKSFHPDDSFRIESPTSATHTQVKEKIGEFEYECEPVTNESDGFSYYICRYDLRGDREFLLAIFYSYPKEIVLSIHSTSMFDE